VATLKKELKARNLSVTGIKSELIQRLASSIEALKSAKIDNTLPSTQIFQDIFSEFIYKFCLKF